MNRMQRNSSIELLRILAMGGIVLLHYIASPGNLLLNIDKGSINYYMIVMANQICVCAVDLFVLITGFYSCNRDSISIRKCLSLTIQVVIFQVIISIIDLLKGGGKVDIRPILYSLIPHNYYVTLYIAMILLSPFINVAMKNLNKSQLSKLMMLLLILFSFQPTIVDIIEGVKGESIHGASMIGILGADWGYTIVNFLLIYFIGLYINRFEFPVKKCKTLILILVGNTALLIIWKLLELKVGCSIGAEHYQNPLIILNAVLLFVIFNQKETNCKIINRISIGSFTVFLVHGKIIGFLPLTSLVNGNVFLLIIRMIINIIAIFAIGDIIGIAYNIVDKYILNKLEKKVHLPVIRV